MKKALFFMLFSGVFLNLEAQNITCFNYDAAGNRIKRYQCCVNCSFEAESENRTSSVLADTGLLTIKAAPNPNTGIFTLISTDTPAEASVQILDVSGRLLLEKRFDNGFVDLSNFSKRLYFIRVVHQNKHRTLHVEKIE